MKFLLIIVFTVMFNVISLFCLLSSVDISFEDVHFNYPARPENTVLKVCYYIYVV